MTVNGCHSADKATRRMRATKSVLLVSLFQFKSQLFTLPKLLHSKCLTQRGVAHATQLSTPRLGSTALGSFSSSFAEASLNVTTSSSAIGGVAIVAQAVLGLVALYAIMSTSEYIYHRFFQHLGINRLDITRALRAPLSLGVYPGDGHVEHHRETRNDMSLDYESGKEAVLDVDAYRNTSFPWDATFKMTLGVVVLAYPTLSFIGWSGYVIFPAIFSAMFTHALMWNAIHPNMHGLPDVPASVGAPSSWLARFRNSAAFRFLRMNHEGHHRAQGAHGNYNVCCPGMDYFAGTNVDPVTGKPLPPAVPSFLLPLVAVLCAPVTLIFAAQMALLFLVSTPSPTTAKAGGQ